METSLVAPVEVSEGVVDDVGGPWLGFLETIMDKIKRRQFDVRNMKLLALCKADNMLDQQGMGKPHLIFLHTASSTPHPPHLILHTSSSTPHPPHLILHTSSSTPHPPHLILHIPAFLTFSALFKAIYPR
jgi:hypothetical protein